jgi:DNA-binding XRE family transcriptional regulator
MDIVTKKRKPNPFSNKLREMRGESGYTQQEVADHLKIAVMTYIRWERGETEPSFSELRSLASMFGKQLNDFSPPED